MTLLDNPAPFALLDVYKIEVCEDCYFAHHYPGENPVESEHIPWSRWPGLTIWQVDDMVDMEDGEKGYTTFSKHRCDGCDTPLAGTRFEMQITLPAEIPEPRKVCENTLPR